MGHASAGGLDGGSAHPDRTELLHLLGVDVHQIELPVLSDRVIERPRVIAALDAVSTPVAVVVAGAGYGKTTALRQFAATDQRDHLWVHLHRYDNDPVALIRLFAAAFVGPVPCRDLLDAAREPHPRARRALPLFGEAMRARAPFVLVVDDADLIDSRDALEFLGHLLDLVPVGSQAFLAGRASPAAHVARRLPAGTAAEITAEVLAFTAEETATLVARVAPELDLPTAGRLAERAMGWPVGLAFATLGLVAGGTEADALNALSAKGRHLARYVHEELLSELDPEAHRFLLRSAVLDRMSGESLDAVLETSGSGQMLDGLARSRHVLLAPVSPSRTYTYHSVFRSILLDDLRDTDPEELVRLRRRAVRWHLDQGQGKLAVGQAMDLGDRELAAQTVFGQTAGLLLSGELATLDQWLDWFSPEEVRASTLLALAEAWHALLADRRGDLERWLALAESLGWDGPLPDGTATFELACAALRMLAGLGGVKETIVHAADVHDAGPGAGPWWATSAHLLAVSRYVAGVIPDAHEAFASAEFEARISPSTHSITLAYLGIAALRSGDRQEGQRLISESAAEMETAAVLDYPLMAVAISAQAYAAAVRGDAPRSRAAADHADQLLRSVWTVLDRGHITARLALTEAALARHDLLDATVQLAEAERRLPIEPDAVMLHEWVDELRDRVDALAAKPGASELTPAEQRVLEQLASHRSLSEIGDYLYVSRNTVKSHTVAIYRKLDVAGRSQAVDMATELGLLPAGGPTDA